jgi:hypothetical protein
MSGYAATAQPTCYGAECGRVTAHRAPYITLGTMDADELSLRDAVRGFAFRSSYGSEPNYRQVKGAGAAAVQLFLQEHPSARSWKQRASFVYHSIPYARRSHAAVELARLALSDRSRHVRYRACMLLACAQDRTTVDLLRAHALSEQDAETRRHIEAAIDAIESGNHNFFVDRGHSGMITLRFEGDGT